MPIELEMVLRLTMATVLGAIIGYQRERAAKPAGLRTHVLISTGAALFTIGSLYGFGSGADPSASRRSQRVGCQLVKERGAGR